jgi:hypothetical protein
VVHKGGAPIEIPNHKRRIAAFHTHDPMILASYLTNDLQPAPACTNNHIAPPVSSCSRSRATSKTSGLSKPSSICVHAGKPGCMKWVQKGGGEPRPGELMRMHTCMHAAALHGAAGDSWHPAA